VADQPRKTATKKIATKKTAAKKSAAKKPAPPKGRRLALSAAEQLAELAGKDVEGVVGLTKDDDGWTVQVETLELRRIPNTTDVLAVYEVTLDADGDLTGYHRVHRYVRGEAREDR
jgi:hypothetical protein